jgi:hypothetical protein
VGTSWAKIQNIWESILGRVELVRFGLGHDCFDNVIITGVMLCSVESGLRQTQHLKSADETKSQRHCKPKRIKIFFQERGAIHRSLVQVKHKRIVAVQTTTTWNSSKLFLGVICDYSSVADFLFWNGRCMHVLTPSC